MLFETSPDVPQVNGIVLPNYTFEVPTTTCWMKSKDVQGDDGSQKHGRGNQTSHLLSLQRVEHSNADFVLLNFKYPGQDLPAMTCLGGVANCHAQLTDRF